MEAIVEQPEALYVVVRNHEEQFSIWRADKQVPAGWNVVGEPAKKASCLDRIAELWTDMRPASLRRTMDADQRGDKETR